MPTITSGSLVTGDTADFTETYSTRNVGTGLTLTPSGTVNDGNGGNNYTYTFVPVSTGVITRRGTDDHGRDQHQDLRRHDERGGDADDHLGQSGHGRHGRTSPRPTAPGTSGTGSDADADRDGQRRQRRQQLHLHVRAGVDGRDHGRALTITAATNTKIYDGTTSAAAAPTITSGSLATGDTADFTETYNTRNAGTGLTLTPTGTVNDGNGGNNYTYTFVPVSTGVITAEALTITAAANTKVYDGTTSAAAVPTITSGSLATGDTADFTETYGTRNVGTGLTLTPSGTVNDGNGGNNYTYTFVPVSTGVITPLRH